VNGALRALPQVPAVMQAAAPAVAAVAQIERPQAVQLEQAPVAAVASVEAPAPAGKKLKEIVSPMVGTFYRRPAVDAEPYVEVGDSVKKGDILCIVEAMKLMNEIECEFTGVVKEVCLEDGQMVEYGEVLFRIE
ncbi:MAG: acetyl-CoA carboxylase biotin carboxyl carrier protein, partial [Bdellovibrionales bacterium]|nr:acetyl-CoA carboxylase biotin carboxyl carrier protein [Bdellovibrionales bacterium]